MWLITLALDRTNIVRRKSTVVFIKNFSFVTGRVACRSMCLCRHIHFLTGVADRVRICRTRVDYYTMCWVRYSEVSDTFSKPFDLVSNSPKSVFITVFGSISRCYKVGSMTNLTFQLINSLVPDFNIFLQSPQFHFLLTYCASAGTKGSLVELKLCIIHCNIGGPLSATRIRQSGDSGGGGGIWTVGILLAEFCAGVDSFVSSAGGGVTDTVVELPGGW